MEHTTDSCNKTENKIFISVIVHSWLKISNAFWQSWIWESSNVCIQILQAILFHQTQLYHVQSSHWQQALCHAISCYIMHVCFHRCSYRLVKIYYRTLKTLLWQLAKFSLLPSLPMLPMKIVGLLKDRTLVCATSVSQGNHHVFCSSQCSVTTSRNRVDKWYSVSTNWWHSGHYTSWCHHTPEKCGRYDMNISHPD